MSTAKLFQKPLAYLFPAFVFIVFAYVLSIKLAWGVFDTACPTYALNMIHQIVDYGYPASFPGVPQVAENYHQGTFWIASLGVKAFHLEPLESLSWLIWIVSSFTIFITLWFGSKLINPSLAALVVFTAYYSASPPNGISLPFQLIKEQLDWYSYISLFEYQISTSWPIALLLILLAILLYYKRPPGSILPLAPLFVLPYFNATAFTVAWLTCFVIAIGGFPSTQMVNRKGGLNSWLTLNVKKLTQLVYLGVALLLALLAPRYFISAFTISPDYEPASIGLRFLQPRFGQALLKYASLMSIFSWLSIIPAIRLAKQKDSYRKFVSYGFLISFLFPIIFWIKSVDQWDNFHKFVLLTSFFSIFVWFFYLSSTYFSRKTLLMYCSISLLLSVPAIFNMATSRMALGRPWAQFELASSPDAKLIQYLNAKTSKVMLAPLKKEDLCSGLSSVLTYGPFSAVGYYFNNFLLSKEIEEGVAQDSKWQENGPQELLKKFPNHELVFIAPKELKGELRETLDKALPFKAKNEKDFESYSVIELSK